jgi:hypothetical protein
MSCPCTPTTCSCTICDLHYDFTRQKWYTSLYDPSNEALLQSNIPSTPLHIQSLQINLKSAVSELSKLDERILRIKSLLNNAEEHRSRLEKVVDDYRALVSPIRHLPYEVIREILDHSVGFDPVVAHPATKLINGPWSLSHVCGLWRAVCLDTPSWWSRISVEYRRVNYSGSLQWLTPTGMSKIIDEGIRRAGRNSLCIAITSADRRVMDGEEYDKRWIPAVVERILLYATRCHTLSVELLCKTDMGMILDAAILRHPTKEHSRSDSESEALDADDDSDNEGNDQAGPDPVPGTAGALTFPFLHKVSLTIPPLYAYGTDTWSDRLWTLLMAAPRLAHVELSRIGLPPEERELSWETLILTVDSLYTSNQTSVCLAFLQQCPILTAYSVCNGHDGGIYPIVRHDKLKDLRIHVDTLLQHVTLPNLQSLVITATITSLSTLSNFISHSSLERALHTLALATDEDLGPFLKMISSLKCLRVALTTKLGVGPLVSLSTRFVAGSSITGLSDSDETPLLSLLETLEISMDLDFMLNKESIKLVTEALVDIATSSRMRPNFLYFKINARYGLKQEWIQQMFERHLRNHEGVFLEWLERGAKVYLYSG